MICAFVFHNVAVGNQKIFSLGTTLKHCNLICIDSSALIAFEMSDVGLSYKILKTTDLDKLCDHIYNMKSTEAIIKVDVRVRHKSWWKPYIVRSCNELCRHIAGVDTGLTLTPAHLYHNLLKYSGDHYKVLSVRRKS